MPNEFSRLRVRPLTEEASCWRLFQPVNAPAEIHSSLMASTHDGIHGKLALVAEDDRTVRNLVVRLLCRSGMRVLAAEDGAEALALARCCGTAVDLLITDYEMPRLNGGDLASELRTLFPDIRIMIMSGVAQSTINASDTLFLQKPFSPTALIDHVHSLLS